MIISIMIVIMFSTQDLSLFGTQWLSGRVLDSRLSGAADSSLTIVTTLCLWARHINPSLVLVQPRKTRPYMTEILLMGRKESNQIKILVWHDKASIEKNGQISFLM